jgi:hypothetical protein
LIMLYWYVYNDSLSEIYTFLRKNHCNSDED